MPSPKPLFPLLILSALSACGETTDLAVVRSQASLHREAYGAPDVEAEPPPQPQWSLEPTAPPTPPPPEDPPPITVTIPADESREPVGTIEGTLSVTPQGAASYEIPLIVPPGFRGIEPNLSLNYHQDRTFGLAGRGFELSGISKIHRCRGTKFLDFIRPRALSATRDDELCLDGQRLVLVDGTHGQSGATYRTEIDSFTQVVANGSCSALYDAPNYPRRDEPRTLSGICEFEVTYKNGTKAWFGGATVAHCSGIRTTIEDPYPVPRLHWPMVSVRDLSGNRMHVDYDDGVPTDNGGNGRTCIPKRIGYGQNTISSRESDRWVRFEYYTPHDEARQVHFEGGVRKARFKYLRRVVTEVGPETAPRTVKSYELSTRLSPASGLPVLDSITECDGGGNCLPSTHFSYSDPELLQDNEILYESELHHSVGLPDSAHRVIVTGDFNGDGRPDYLTKVEESLFGDFDLFQSSTTNPSPYIWDQTTLANPFAVSATPLAYHGLNLSDDGPAAGDFDGDGFDDLFIPVALGYQVYFGSPSGLPSAPSQIHSHTQLLFGTKKILGDFDADGRSEIVAFAGTALIWTQFEWRGAVGFQSVSTDQLPTIGSVPDFDEFPAHHEMDVVYLGGDYNGDGRTDILAHRRVFLGYYNVPDSHDYSKTDHEDQRRFWHDPDNYQYGNAYLILTANDLGGFDLFDQGVWPEMFIAAVPGEFNGDGLTDLLLVADSGSVVQFSTGTEMSLDTDPTLNQNPYQTFAQVHSGTAHGYRWTPTHPNIKLGQHVYPADFNGDGRDDLVTVDALAVNDRPFGVHLYTAVGARHHLSIMRFRETPIPAAITPDGGSLIVGDLAGRGLASILYRGGGNAQAIGGRFTYFNERPDRLRAITDGLGKRIEINYEPVSQKPSYERGSSLPAPKFRVRPSQEVVRETRTFDPQSGQEYGTSYDFDEGAFDPNGRGFLGYGKVRKSDGQTLELTEHRLAFPFTGLVSRRQVQRVSSLSDRNGPLIRETIYTHSSAYTMGAAQDIRITDESSVDYQLYISGASDPGTRSTVSRHYDAYGNVVSETTDPNLAIAGDEVTVRSAYSNNVADHQLGILRVRETMFGGTYSMTENFEYDSFLNTVFHGTLDVIHNRRLGVRHQYNVLGNLDRSVHPDGGETRYTYLHNDVDFVVVDPTGNKTSKRFDVGLGVEIERTDSNDLATTFTVDGFGRVTSISGPTASGETPETLKTFERIQLWDADGDQPAGYIFRSRTLENWSDRSPEGWRIEDELHDSLGRVRVRRKLHSIDGATAGLVDLWVQSDVHYHNERPSEVVAESRSYYSHEANPVFTQFRYDVKGRPTAVYRTDGEVVQFVYDDLTRQIARHEPGNSTLLALDARGNLVAKRTANGGVTRYAYDNLSRLVQTWDPVGVSTAVGYDSLGRKVYVNHSDTGLSQILYDTNGRLAAEVDPKGQSIVRGMDGADRTISRSFYDAAGEMESRITYHFDDPSVSYGRGRLTQVQREDGSGTVLQDHEFGYDRLGRQTEVRVQMGELNMATSYAFSPSGEATEMTYPDGSRLRLNHLRGGLLRSIDLDDSQSSSVGFRELVAYREYDADGRPTVETRGNNTVVCQRYDVRTGRIERTAISHFPGQSPQTPCGHVDDEEDGYVRTDYLDRDYQWETAGRIKTINDQLDASRSQSFTYDSVGQLMGANAPALYGTMDYTYDAAGNRISHNGVVSTYSGHHFMSDTAGLSADWDDNGNMLSQLRSGNVLKAFEWTVDDRLASVTTPDGQTRYDYDFTGHRVFKADASTGNQTWYFGREYEVMELPSGQRLATKSIPGPAGMIAQITTPWSAPTQQSVTSQWHTVGRRIHRGSALYEALETVASLSSKFDANELALWTGRSWFGFVILSTLILLFLRIREDGALKRRPAVAAIATASCLTVFGLGDRTAHAAPGPNGAGAPASSGLIFLYGDHVGSTSLVLTDGPNPTVLTRYDYQPFGQLAASTFGSDQVRPKLHGQELDAGTGLYYAGERYMDPELGIFVSADTSIGAKVLDALSLHRYAFAANNPITYRDPSGRFAITVTSILVGIAVGAVAGALVGGTGGKIITDPLNAFKNWSWGWAALGAFMGASVGGVGAGMGAAGSMVSIGSMNLKSALTTMWSTAIVRATMTAAHGGDGFAIFNAFGIGAVSGFIAGSGFFGMASVNGMGKWMASQLSALTDTALKLVADQEVSLKISLWVFSVTIDHHGKPKLGIEYKFLEKKAFGFLGDLSQEKAWGKPSGKLAKDLALNVGAADDLPDGMSSFFGLSGIVRKTATGQLGFYEGAADIARSFTGYGASVAKKTRFVKDSRVLGTVGVSRANAAAEKGIEKGLCALDPKASGC